MNSLNETTLIDWTYFKNIELDGFQLFTRTPVNVWTSCLFEF